MLKRITTFIYGVLSYSVFFGTFLYAIGFIGNILVPKSIDSGRTGPLLEALVIDAALLTVFAVQHSLMARPWFKRGWTQLVPKPAERSTYVLLSSLALLLLFWRWRPIGGEVWNVDQPAIRIALFTLCASGWLLVLGSTFQSITSIFLDSGRFISTSLANRTRRFGSALQCSTNTCVIHFISAGSLHSGLHRR